MPNADVFEKALSFSIGKMSLGNIISAIIIYIICFFVISALSKPIDNFLNKLHYNPTTSHFLRTVIKALLNFVAMIMICDSIGIPVSSLLAILGMLGLAISLSVQGALANLANGILILMTKPFIVGDYVSVSGNEGVVKEVGILSTKLLTNDNKWVIVPNSEIFGKDLINFTHESLRRVDLIAKVGFDNDIDKVKASLLEAIAATPNTLQDPVPFARLAGAQKRWVEYTVRAWCKTEDYWTVYFDLIENISRVNAKNGIIPFTPGGDDDDD